MIVYFLGFIVKVWWGLHHRHIALLIQPLITISALVFWRWIYVLRRIGGSNRLRKSRTCGRSHESSTFLHHLVFYAAVVRDEGFWVYYLKLPLSIPNPCTLSILKHPSFHSRPNLLWRIFHHRTILIQQNFVIFLDIGKSSVGGLIHLIGWLEIQL